MRDVPTPVAREGKKEQEKENKGGGMLQHLSNIRIDFQPFSRHFLFTVYLEMLTLKWKSLNRHMNRNGPTLRLAIRRNCSVIQLDLQMHLLFDFSKEAYSMAIPILD